MICYFRLMVLFLGVVLGGVYSFGETVGSIDPSRIVVLANAEDKDSLEIANYYIKARNLPEANLLAIPMPLDETLDWNTFVEKVYNPVLAALVEKKWLVGTLSSQKDPEGRVQAVILENKIDFLVVCRIPLRVDNNKPYIEAQVQLPPQKEFQVTNASVDAELALLAAGRTPIIGFIANPLFRQENPPEMLRRQVVPVARLDGPTVDGVKRMIDSALQGEKLGLRGRAYIDMGGPHPRGDEWLDATGKLVESMYYPVSWDRDRALFGWKTRLDAPAIYFGWWTQNISGPFADRSFRFPAGAIVFHIHSYSATTMRNANLRWSGPLAERGVAVTVGNVYEPYLELTHHPAFFFKALQEGRPAGEAAYYALPVLSWQAVFVGDPLYRPFLVDLNEQLKARVRPGDSLAQYVYLREVERLKAAGKSTEALEYARKRFRDAPGLALGYAIAQMEEAAGNRSAAISALDFVGTYPKFAVDEQGLAYVIANFLNEQGAKGGALKIFETLLEKSRLTKNALKAYLPDGIQLANQLGRVDLAEKWTALNNELNKPKESR